MGVTNFVWDPFNDSLLLEKDNIGFTQATYTTTPAHFGEILSRFSDSYSTFLHFDAIYNVRQTSDPSSVVQREYLYLAFGEPIGTVGGDSDGTRFGGELGYYYDHALRSAYARRRSLLPAIGRWLSRDILPGSSVPYPYSYVDNNPINYFDASGLLKVTMENQSKPQFCGDINVKRHFTWTLADAKGEKSAVLVVRFVVIEDVRQCDPCWTFCVPSQRVDACCYEFVERFGTSVLPPELVTEMGFGFEVIDRHQSNRTQKDVGPRTSPFNMSRVLLIRICY